MYDNTKSVLLNYYLYLYEGLSSLTTGGEEYIEECQCKRLWVFTFNTLYFIHFILYLKEINPQF